MDGKSMCRLMAVSAALAIITVSPGRAVRAQSPERASVADAHPTSTIPTTLVTIDAVNTPLADVLESIARQATLNPFWRDKVLDGAPKVTVHLKDVPVAVAFAKVLEGTGMQARVSARHVEIVAGRDVGLVGVVSGRVIDEHTKHPVHGATIAIDDAKKGVTSSNDGTFRITGVAAGTHTVHVRMMGYGRRTVSVTVADDQVATLEVMLEPSVNALDQVVVTGTVIPTELKAVPSAMTVITGKELEERGITHIDQLFRGDVPGVWAQSLGSSNLYPGQVRTLTRGANSMYNDSDLQFTKAMKTYVDGVELADPQYLGLIDPKSIERIEILTGPQASTIYGSGAISGVMQVFTKRGATIRPQVTASFQSGLVQNNFNAAKTSQHTASLQASQTTGLVSYNVGGTWSHVGPWTPAVNPTTTSSFGGARLQEGPLTADVSLRYVTAVNHDHGGADQFNTVAVQNGYEPPTVSARTGVLQPYDQHSIGQSAGFTVTYAPTSWWSQTGTLGHDESNAYQASRMPTHAYADDSLLVWHQNDVVKTNLAYNTTLRVPMASVANVTVTGGADAFHSLLTAIDGNVSALTGPGYLGRSFAVARFPSRATGAFVQSQLSVRDAIFLTYGVRADWNPTFGDDANPNVVPRYGISMVRDFNTPLGPITAKVRGSYGHSTRAPFYGEKTGQSVCITDVADCATYTRIFGSTLLQTDPNPDLVPEAQQGGEGGLELYFGNRGSLIVTRYNQTVDHLIAYVIGFDSTRSLQPQFDSPYYAYGFDEMFDHIGAGGYSYFLPRKNINLGDIRNQGWELQGTINTGPLTTKGTYSWTMSRVIGVTRQYEKQTGVVPGSAYNFLPEHTYALDFRYAHGGTTLSLDLQGQSMVWSPTNPGQSGLLGTPLGDAWLCSFNSRLWLQCPDLSGRVAEQMGQASGYAQGDLNVAQRLSSTLEGTLQIQNVRNSYRNDAPIGIVSMGRQTSLGFRFRW